MLTLLKNIVLITILIIISYTDIKRQEIDHWPLLLGLVFILPYTLLGYNNVTTGQSLMGFLVGGGFFTILSFWGMGGGDVKLMALIGLFLGWKQLLLAMYLSFILGSIIGIGVIVIRKKKMKDFLPFGPSIALATTFVLFFGEKLVNNLDFLFYLR